VRANRDPSSDEPWPAGGQHVHARPDGHARHRYATGRGGTGTVALPLTDADGQVGKQARARARIQTRIETTEQIVRQTTTAVQYLGQLLRPLGQRGQALV
jgi:hypothetical protein